MAASQKERRKRREELFTAQKVSKALPSFFLSCHCSTGIDTDPRVWYLWYGNDYRSVDRAFTDCNFKLQEAKRERQQLVRFPVTDLKQVVNMRRTE